MRGGPVGRVLAVSTLTAGISGIASTAASARDSLVLRDGRIVDDRRIEKTAGGYSIHYENGVVQVAEALVRDAFLEGAEGFVPRDEEERKKVEAGLVPFEGRWISKAQRSAAIVKRDADKRRRLEEIRSHSEWRNRYKVSTSNFAFEHTIPPEVFENYKNLMETYLGVFTKKWGISKPPRIGRLSVCFYSDYDAFLQVTGAWRGVLAYYRFVEPLELDFFYDRTDPELTTAVMFHEANHYLTHLIDLSFRYPHCLNEAMAEYYGASRWDPKTKKMTTGHVQEGRLTEVLADIQDGEWPSLEKYLANELGYKDYSWGWTFVHFMMETPKYASRFRSFYLALARAPEVKRVEAMGGFTVEGDEIVRLFRSIVASDLSALEKEWRAYVQSSLRLESERGYEKAAVKAMESDQPLRAERFFKLALEKATTNPVAYAKYGQLLVNQKKAKDAVEVLKKGIELDPLFAPLYATLGRAYGELEGAENKAEARRLLQLAAEIDPEVVEFDVALQRAIRKAAS